MKIELKKVLTAVLAVAISPLCIAEGDPGVPVAFVDQDNDSCEANYDGTDSDFVYMQCINGACIVTVGLCDTREDKAKYRVHFDTEEPYFDDGRNNPDCLATSDDVAMYRPGPGKVTGPQPFPYLFDNGNMIQWVIPYAELGIGAGDYVAAWLEIHDKGMQDRVPDTDDSDGCAEPQYSDEVLEVLASP